MYEEKKYTKKDNKIRGSGIIYYYIKNNIHHILCVKGKLSRKWGLPKGSFKDKDEKYKECAIREMHEETNVIIEPSHLSNKSLDFGNHKYYIVKAFTLEDIKCNDTSEINEIRFLSETQINNLEKYKKNLGLRKFMKWLIGD